MTRPIGNIAAEVLHSANDPDLVALAAYVLDKEQATEAGDNGLRYWSARARELEAQCTTLRAQISSNTLTRAQHIWWAHRVVGAAMLPGAAVAATYGGLGLAAAAVGLLQAWVSLRWEPPRG
jgi:hypothetical protein